MTRALVISVLACAALSACATRNVEVTLNADDEAIARASQGAGRSVLLTSGESFEYNSFSDVGPALCFTSHCERKADLAQITFREKRADFGRTVSVVSTLPLTLPGAVILATVSASAGAGRSGGDGDSPAAREDATLRLLARSVRRPVVFEPGGLTLDGLACATAPIGSGEVPRTDVEAGRWVVSHYTALSSDCVVATKSLWEAVLGDGERDAMAVFVQVRKNWEALQCDRVLIGGLAGGEPAARVYGVYTLQPVRAARNRAGAFALMQALMADPDQIAYDAPLEAICRRLGTEPVDPALFEERTALFLEVADPYYSGPPMIVDGERRATGTVSTAMPREASRELASLIAALPTDTEPAPTPAANAMDNPA